MAIVVDKPETPAALKGIAETLYAAAVYMPESSLAHDDPAVFRFGPLTLRCRPDAPSVRKLAARYDVTGVTIAANCDVANQRYNQCGEPSRSQSVRKRWFDPRLVPLSQAGEGRGKR